jgi:hypothetical protein
MVKHRSIYQSGDLKQRTKMTARSNPLIQGLSISWLIIQLVLAGLFMSRISLNPVKPIFPRFSLMGAMSLTLLNFTYSIRYFPNSNFNCNWWMILCILLVGCSGIVQAVRQVFIALECYVIRKKIHAQTLDDFKKIQPLSHFLNRIRTQGRIRIRAVVFISTINPTIAGTISYLILKYRFQVDPTWQAQDDACAQIAFDGVKLAVPFFVTPIVVCFFMVLYNVQFVKDNFYLREQNIIYGFVATAVLVWACLFSNDTFLDWVKRADMDVLSLTSLMLAVIMNSFTVFLPYLRTYSMEFSEANDVLRKRIESPLLRSDAISLDNFLIFLQSQEGFLLFEEFLCGEFSVESLWFWRDIQKLKTKGRGLSDAHFLQTTVSVVQGTNAKELVQEIIEKYIYDDAPLLINISFKTRTEMLKSFKMLESQSVVTSDQYETLFQAAEQEILLMLKSDSWSRFLQKRKITGSSSSVQLASSTVMQ